MTRAALPPNEVARLAALRSFEILDTPPDPRFDAFTRIAARLFDAPIAVISLLDDDRQWFKSAIGLDALQTPRDCAFCAHAILDPSGTLVVEDASVDPRFADNPMVMGDPRIRFYAGAPLVDGFGNALGALCVIGTTPRRVTAQELLPLQDLAAGVVTTLELHRALAETRRVATHDPLTGLANRTCFASQLARVLPAALENGTPCAVLCLDLDRFKSVNDRFGHAGGDLLLRETARRLTGVVRGDDLVARLGGDEFTVLLPELPHPEVADQVAHRLIARLAEPFEIDGQAYPIRTSIGIAFCPADATDAATLLRHADAALYRAKREGRGVVRRYAAGPDDGAGPALGRDLHAALEAGRLALLWQPLHSLSDNIATGYEALPYWPDALDGALDGAGLRAVAARAGLGHVLDRWLLHAACERARRLPGTLRVTVGVSEEWCRHGDLPAMVAGVLQETGLAPARLEILITERMLLDLHAWPPAETRRLRALGVRLALDEFTGRLSFAGLMQHRLDSVCLDVDLTGDVTSAADARALVRGLLQLRPALRLTVCARGVDTEAQRATLQAAGCDEAQGALFGTARAEIEMAAQPA